MDHHKKFPLWVFPVLGIILGFAWAFIFMHGLVVPWQFIGKPSEPITKIIGFVGGPNLFVETESGTVYSIEYYNYINGRDFLPTPIKWTKVENTSLEPIPVRQGITNFISLPLVVRIKQTYEMEFPLVEGYFLAKFVLDENGDLWLWNYGQGGFAGITYILYPLIGALGGGFLALLIKLGGWVSRKFRQT